MNIQISTMIMSNLEKLELIPEEEETLRAEILQNITRSASINRKSNSVELIQRGEIIREVYNSLKEDDARMDTILNQKTL